jgi:hypothetical protein
VHLLSAPRSQDLQRNAPLPSLLNLRFSCRELGGVSSKHAATFRTLFAPPASHSAVSVMPESPA